MKVSLSFDFEEFDLPREHGVEISTDEAVRISAGGARPLLDLRHMGAEYLPIGEPAAEL